MIEMIIPLETKCKRVDTIAKVGWFVIIVLNEIPIIFDASLLIDSVVATTEKIKSIIDTINSM